MGLLLTTNRDLKALAERWQPLLLRPHRKRDWFMRLIRAQSESDMLKGFLTGTDERINSFLVSRTFSYLHPNMHQLSTRGQVRFAVQSWVSHHRSSHGSRNPVSEPHYRLRPMLKLFRVSLTKFPD